MNLNLKIFFTFLYIISNLWYCKKMMNTKYILIFNGYLQSKVSKSYVNKILKTHLNFLIIQQKLFLYHHIIYIHLKNKYCFKVQTYIHKKSTKSTLLTTFGEQGNFISINKILTIYFEWQHMNELRCFDKLYSVVQDTATNSWSCQKTTIFSVSILSQHRIAFYILRRKM